MALLENTIKALVKMIKSSEIKYAHEARLNETIESIRYGERYISAVNGLSGYYTYTRLSIQAIQMSGVVDLQLQQQYHEFKETIPKDLLPTIIANEDKLTIRNYVEMNNYYRTLNGLPKIDDNEKIYPSNEFTTLYNIPIGIPVHELNETYQIILNVYGETERLYKLHPTKEYLKYIGDNKISILSARMGKNFELIRLAKTESETLNNMFIETYSMCRDYVVSNIYVREFVTSYKYYDEFMAMLIMIMTIQRMLVVIFKDNVNSDFYDLPFIKMIFDQYKVPFIQNMPIIYQRKLVGALNYLIHIKSTDRVIFDISKLMGFENITIFKYFILKKQKEDANGNFVFEYLKDAEGNVILDENGKPKLDVSKLYTYYFQSVDLKSKNVVSELDDSKQMIDIPTVTSGDPYWYTDEQMVEFLNNEQFNFMETKYISFQAVYRMSEMLFDINYTVRLIMDNKRYMTKKFDLSKLVPNAEVNLFEIVTLLCALLSKKCALPGRILYDPDNIATIMGFNFTNTLTELIAILENNPLFPPSILINVRNIYINRNNISVMFESITNIKSILSDIIFTASDVNTCLKAKDLYDTLMTMEDTAVMYKKTNNDIAITFEEYIQSEMASLYSILELDADDDNDSYTYRITVLLDILSKEINSLENLHFINETDNAMLNNMITIVRYFKSYTVDIHNVNIIYIMDDKRMNTLKLFMELNHIDKTNVLTDQLDLSDLLIISKILLIEDIMNLYDKVDIEVQRFIYDYMELNDVNSLHWYDFLQYYTELHLRDYIKLAFADSLKTNSVKRIYESVPLKEEIILRAIRKTYEHMALYDTNLIQTSIYTRENLHIKDMVKSVVTHFINELAYVADHVNDIKSIMSVIDSMVLYETTIRIACTNIDENMLLDYSDSLKVLSKLLYGEDSLNLRDAVKIIKV